MTLSEAVDRMQKAEAEVERLRKLLRNKDTDMTPAEYVNWMREVKAEIAAGRGEG